MSEAEDNDENGVLEIHIETEKCFIPHTVKFSVSLGFSVIMME